MIKKPLNEEEHMEKYNKTEKIVHVCQTSNIILNYKKSIHMSQNNIQFQQFSPYVLSDVLKQI